MPTPTLPRQAIARVKRDPNETKNLILQSFDDLNIIHQATAGAEKQEIARRLFNSSIHRSRLNLQAESVRSLLEKTTEWTEVVAIGTESVNKDILLFQGILPDTVQAFTAFTTVEDIYRRYGPKGQYNITVEKGRMNPTDFFLSVPFEVQTDYITVKIKHEDGVHRLLSWHVGPCHSSILHENPYSIANILVHCNCPPLQH